MKFIYRGEFSKGMDTQEMFGVVFTGREPSEVREDPAINWMAGHPDYEAQPEPVVEKEPRPVKPPRSEKKARKVKK